MAFREVIMPKKISLGVTGGPKFKTTILELSSGYEKRNIDWSKTRAEYDFSYAVKDPDEKEELVHFFYAMNGRAHGFRFFDWSDYLLSRQSIGATDGSTATFQIYKRYTTSAYTFDRVLTKISLDADVENTVISVWVNNSLITEGAGATQFQINRNTGVITLGSTHAATTGQDVEVQCEFHVPVRFDTDHLQITITDPTSFDWSGLKIVELRV